MASILVPPGGFAGAAQQAPAVRNQIAKDSRSLFVQPRRSRAARKRILGGGAKKRILGGGKRRRRGRSRLAKGSAAAKRYMAKLRGMRKRR